MKEHHAMIGVDYLGGITWDNHKHCVKTCENMGGNARKASPQGFQGNYFGHQEYQYIGFWCRSRKAGRTVR